MTPDDIPIVAPFNQQLRVLRDRLGRRGQISPEKESDMEHQRPLAAKH